MEDGFECTTNGYAPYEMDHGNGVENYECDGCRADGFTGFNCGVCPHNSERIREYRKKYVY